MPNARGEGSLVYRPNAQIKEMLRANTGAFFPMVREICGDDRDNDCDGQVNNGCPSETSTDTNPESTTGANLDSSTATASTTGANQDSSTATGSTTGVNLDSSTATGSTNGATLDSSTTTTSTTGASLDSGTQSTTATHIDSTTGCDTATATSSTSVDDREDLQSSETVPPTYDFVTETCQNCAEDKCRDVFGYDLVDIVGESIREIELLECIIREQCASESQLVYPCYCGDVQNPTACFTTTDPDDEANFANGPCKGIFEYVMGTTDPLEIASAITSPELPGGGAGMAGAYCVGNLCIDECAYPEPRPSRPPVVDPPLTTGPEPTSTTEADSSCGSDTSDPSTEPDQGPFNAAYVTAACETCVQQECADTLSFDLASLPLGTPEDRALLQCVIETGCIDEETGALPCYCGDVQDPVVCFDPARTLPSELPNGSCKELYERALGTEARQDVAPLLNDPSVTGGKVGFVALGCIGPRCLSACGGGNDS